MFTTVNEKLSLCTVTVLKFDEFYRIIKWLNVSPLVTNVSSSSNGISFCKCYWLNKSMHTDVSNNITILPTLTNVSNHINKSNLT